VATDWSTHTWNKGSQKQNYVDQYRKNLWDDLLAADTNSDKNLSNAEFGTVWDKMYDIIGDGRAPHSGGWFDKGAGAQNALAKLITRHGISVDNSLLNRFGLRQDQETGDILAGVGFKHRESNFGRDADDDLSSWEGYSTKADFADSDWSFSDYGDEIPTYRYKWSNTDAFSKPDTGGTQQIGDIQGESLPDNIGDTKLDPRTGEIGGVTGPAGIWSPSDSLIKGYIDLAQMKNPYSGADAPGLDSVKGLEFSGWDSKTGQKLTDEAAVIRSFNKAFDRNPTGEELAKYVGAMTPGKDSHGGLTIEQLNTMLPATTEGKLNNLYKTVFNRPLGQEGGIYWMNNIKTDMAGGMSRKEAEERAFSNIMNDKQTEWVQKQGDRNPWDEYQNAATTSGNTTTSADTLSSATTSSSADDAGGTAADTSFYGVDAATWEGLSGGAQANLIRQSNKKSAGEKHAYDLQKQKVANMEMAQLGYHAVDSLSSGVVANLNKAPMDAEAMFEKWSKKIKEEAKNL
jgi:hypothetical protein